MHRARLAVLALAVTGSLFAAAPPASACTGTPCDLINVLCQDLPGIVHCVR